MDKNLIENLLWSVALPGFGQFLNGKYYKGTVMVILEYLVNVQSNFNEVIILSFQGNIQKGIEQTDFSWLMFYPCLYFFAIWDAFKEAGGGKYRYSFLPCVFGAYFRDHWINLVPKINLIWRVNWSGLAPYLVCYSWSNIRFDF